MISRSAVVFLTEACDKACPHCFNALDPDMAGGPEPLDIDTALAVLRAARRRGVQTVAVTGGEPLLHPDAVRFVDGCTSLGLNTLLFTSGTGLDVHARALQRAGLDGIRFSINELAWLRDVAGLDRLWPTVVERLEPARVPFEGRITVNVLVSGRNPQLVAPVLARLADLGIHRVKVQPFFAPPGRTMARDAHLAVLSDEQWDALDPVLRAAGVPGQAAYVDVFRAYYQHGTRPTACGAGPMLVIGADGGVRPCLNRFDLRVAELCDPPETVLDAVAARQELRRAACFREPCLALFRPQA